jgi:ABC-type multidrug transport system ATPase subunit
MILCLREISWNSWHQLENLREGLDAKSSRIVKDLVSLHAQKGGAVLFSTHIMEVAEQTCTRIGIINQGAVVAEGTLAELRSRTGQDDTLEEVFLKLTNEESEVAETTKMLREAFFKSEAS